MVRAVTPKLVNSVALAGLGLWLALITGRVEAVAAVAPLIVAVAAGLASAKSPDVLVDCAMDVERCLEGDEVNVAVTVTSTEAVEDLRLALVVPTAFSVEEGASDSTISLAAGGSQRLNVRLRCQRWGVHRLGEIAVRVASPGGYVVWEQTVDRSSPVKVFPYLERIRQGVAPPVTHVFSGNHVARVSGDGIEFAQVRSFQPGDKVRSVNWRVSSRRELLHVNVFHPERNADVVLFLDSFGNFGGSAAGSLEMAVRGAAGVARAYLEHKDRVGLVAFGGEVRWLTASMGRTQIYRIVDVLLESRALFSYAWKGIEHLPYGTLPSSATVIAFSPLIDKRSVAALEDIAGRGFSLVVVDTLEQDAVAPLPGPEGALAYRVWLLARAARRAELATLGVPVVRWSEPDGLNAALASVPRLPKVRHR